MRCLDILHVELYCRNHEKYGDQRMTVVAYQGDMDVAMGKAKKRIAQKLYERISGVTLSDDDGPAASVTVIESDVIANDPGTREEIVETTIPVDWAAEFKRYGVTDQGTFLRDAPTQADRDSVLSAAKKMVGDGMEFKAFDCLVRYDVELAKREAVVA